MRQLAGEGRVEIVLRIPRAFVARGWRPAPQRLSCPLAERALRLVTPREVRRFLSALTSTVEGLEEPTAGAKAAGFRALRTATGFLAITVSKVRAGASGVLRPPSQCLIASRLKPNVSENLACVMPSRLRMAFTSTSWGTCALNPSCSP